MFISFVVYFYIGSVYEERKLIKIFGNDYLEYQKMVSRIFPVKLITRLSDVKSEKD
jgi:protein-S-isoprenylcysteine O-methyltransferase Ste14